MATLHAPVNLSSCSFDGIEYVVKDGVVEVPHHAVAHLVSHGFTKGAAPIVLPPPIIGLDEHEKVKNDLVAAEQLLKEQQGQIDALRADLDAARKLIPTVAADGKKSGPK